MSEAAPIVSVEVVLNATAAVRDLTRVLRYVGRLPAPDFKAKHNRFRLLCFDLFGGDSPLDEDPAIKAASFAVAAVETGRLGRRNIPDFIRDCEMELSEEDRAFAIGLAFGFMTEFLPRAGG